MIVSPIILIVFLFCLGASIGSFLNVVIYRLPREMSIVRPGSHCTRCQKPIAWYDNLPILSWFILRGRCRHCGERFSFRYALVELVTAGLFVGFYGAYFHEGAREAMPPFMQGGAAVYAGHIVLICVLLASSLIDREHWIIPLSLSYTAVIAGLAGSTVWPYILEGPVEEFRRIVPFAGAKTAAWALGGTIGLIISYLLVKAGVITRSFIEWEKAMAEREKKIKECGREVGPDDKEFPEPPVHIRREMGRELLFVLPVVMGAWAAGWLLAGADSEQAQWWKLLISQQKWFAGLLGGIFGFIIGGGVVWATRILGSLAFGREAMGLGDVHLMAAVGAMLGWPSAVLAFFIAPFFGLGWALSRLFFHRMREIQYGPFLALATALVMLVHDPLVEYFRQALMPLASP